MKDFTVDEIVEAKMYDSDGQIILDDIAYSTVDSDSFNKHYDTWIIAYCPDTDEFFATDQRFFFWETEETYKTKEDAINCFESHISYFLNIKNKILSGFIYGYEPQDYVWLSNTMKKYYAEEQ